MSEPLSATSRQLWRLNITPGKLRLALDRCPSGVIDRETAREVLAEFMPNKRRAPAEPGQGKGLIRELNRLDHRRRS